MAIMWLFVIWSILMSTPFDVIYVYADNHLKAQPGVRDDRDNLYAFKKRITNDYGNCISNWNPRDAHSCAWDHIKCDTDKRVKRIDLGNCSMVGSLAEELGNLAKLQILSLPVNALHGPIPSSFGRLTNLICLDLTGNAIKSQIPREILGYLQNMEQLRLSSNVLTGSIPPELGNLASLMIFLLDDNFLNGSIPMELSNLKKLNIFDLSFNNLNGTVPKELAQNFPEISSVDLRKNEGPGGQGGLTGPCTQAPCCYGGECPT